MPSSSVSSTPDHGRADWRERFAALAIYALVALVATWPLAWHPRALLGAPQGHGDPYLNLFTLGWDLRQLFAAPMSWLDGSVFDAPIFHPARQTLAFTDHLLVQALLADAEPFTFESLEVRRQAFYSRVTNLGFRVLAAEGELGWKPMQVYNCGAKPFTDDTCVNAGQETLADPVLTPLLGYEVARGDVLKSQVVHVDFGDVGMLFLPGEVPSELVIGLPGGGGLGDPKERDPEAVRQDLLDDLISARAARDLYGVALTETGEVDQQETERLRQSEPAAGSRG